MNKYKNSEFIKLSKIFQCFRTIVFSRKNENGINVTVKNVRRPGEIFFSVKSKAKTFQGYVKTNEYIKEYQNHLFQDRIKYGLGSIELIEWEDRYLLLVKDGLCISDYSLFVTKEEVVELFGRAALQKGC